MESRSTQFFNGNFGYWMLDACPPLAGWLLDTGCWILAAGGIQDAGCKIQVVCNRVNRQTGKRPHAQVSGVGFQDTRCKIQDTGRSELT
ncbi:hypothetical protein D3OALGB2SA_5090 [Olavius algarvensis associated proteobacterium Delta 3]|nr:hypothetical protein D3OALGB2SA_5090 [Olavius algarvensis associated proteobacterium Delta 3]